MPKHRAVPGGRSGQSHRQCQFSPRSAIGPKPFRVVCVCRPWWRLLSPRSEVVPRPSSVVCVRQHRRLPLPAFRSRAASAHHDHTALLQSRTVVTHTNQGAQPCRQNVLSLMRWSSQIHAGFPGSRVTRDDRQEIADIRVRGYNPLRRKFPQCFHLSSIL
jgi:hypothetical protein